MQLDDRLSLISATTSGQERAEGAFILLLSTSPITARHTSSTLL